MLHTLLRRLVNKHGMKTYFYTTSMCTSATSIRGLWPETGTAAVLEFRESREAAAQKPYTFRELHRPKLASAAPTVLSFQRRDDPGSDLMGIVILWVECDGDQRFN